MKQIKSLSARPGEEISSSFRLPSHIDQNLSPKQSAEKLVKFFYKISQEFKPIEEDTLPQRVNTRLELDPCNHPNILEHEVYECMKASKKTDSVPGDIPSSILKEFLPEFASPVTSILKEAVRTHE